MFGKISTPERLQLGGTKMKNVKKLVSPPQVMKSENHVGKQGAINFGGFLRIVPQFTHC